MTSRRPPTGRRVRQRLPGTEPPSSTRAGPHRRPHRAAHRTPCPRTAAAVRPGRHHRRHGHRDQQRRTGRPDPGGRAAPGADGSLRDGRRLRGTQADGSYQVAGLFPGELPAAVQRRRVRPTSSTRAPPTRPVRPRCRPPPPRSPPGMNVVITGQPASITGAVDPGDTLHRRHHGHRPGDPGRQRAGQDVATTTTDGNNAYSLADLPAPAVYELSFAAAGYQPSVVTTRWTAARNGSSRPCCSPRARADLRGRHRRQRPVGRDHRQHHRRRHHGDHRHADHR